MLALLVLPFGLSWEWFSAADIFRLIALNERSFDYEWRGRELPGHELRRIAERAWHQFLKHGW
jgi:hypothetical protein